ncbi:zinc-binding domain-containing protein [Xylaria scruposa]|nr:zinc-binding domain-containing protein [Xylaria scruposa]
MRSQSVLIVVPIHSSSLALAPKPFSAAIMPNRRPKQVKSWSMYPDLHDDVAGLLDDDGLKFTFHHEDDDRDCIKNYDTNVMGRFACRNANCSSHGWSSKRIAITIRLYRDNKYNARIWHQRCKRCNQLSKPLLDDSYSERVAYRIKKWSGIALEAPRYYGTANAPHETKFCEGCEHGHCRQLNG